MAKDKIFTIGAQLDGVSPLKDGGMSVRFHTQEITDNNERVILMSYYQKYGHLLFSADEIKEEMIPEKTVDIEGKRVKTPSQRLRATIWVRWDQSDKSLTEDEFYIREMERLIEYEKGKLEPR